MKVVNTRIGWQTEHEEDVDVLTEELHSLIVWNDDVNTFDWVIESLIEVCDHDPLQAEQCTYIIHNNGKCSVKKGTYSDLKPQAVELLNRSIQATIDY
ncbi:MAG: ATP-dependent Clp protease adaptor ClpS [Chitinophagia bacterium]|nr:ATP-dependent Clp protease adaptor ClpS [Chitinophagia bacterium]